MTQDTEEKLMVFAGEVFVALATSIHPAIFEVAVLSSYSGGKRGGRKHMLVGFVCRKCGHDLIVVTNGLIRAHPAWVLVAR